MLNTGNTFKLVTVCLPCGNRLVLEAIQEFDEDENGQLYAYGWFVQVLAGREIYDGLNLDQQENVVDCVLESLERGKDEVILDTWKGEEEDE